MCRYNSLLLTLTELLKFMARKEASDLHLKPMRPPLLRIKGRLMSVNTEVLQPAELGADRGRNHHRRPSPSGPASARDVPWSDQGDETATVRPQAMPSGSEPR